MFREISPLLKYYRIFPTFSPIRFIVSVFMWRSLIHLDLRLYTEIRNGLISILLHKDHQLKQYQLLKKALFPLAGFSSFVKDQVTISVWVHFGSSIPFHWSNCLVLYQYHAGFIMITLSYSLRSRMIISPRSSFTWE